MREPVNTCPDCGDFHFHPWQCPFDLHGEDDFFNAAKNVAELYLRRGHQPPRGRSVSQYALKSGSRTPS
jgi:hypothetical protein